MRIAVLSDVHANLAALEAVLGAIGSVDAVWHLGDLVGYGPEPDAVVHRLREAGAIGVRGNHDTAASLDPSLAEWFNPDARQAIEWTRDRIEPDTRTWLAGLPERIEDGAWTLVHGSPRDPLWEYVTTTSVARSSFKAMTTRFGLHGHTHVPIAMVEDGDRIRVVEPIDGSDLDLAAGEGHLLLNPGSVGQPRDGRSTASWLEVDDDAGRASWHRIEYDIAAVQARMLELGLPARLATRLGYGI